MNHKDLKSQRSESLYRQRKDALNEIIEEIKKASSNNWNKFVGGIFILAASSELISFENNFLSCL